MLEKLPDLAAPIEHHRGGADDEHREARSARLADPFHGRQRLECLPEAHVIGEDAIEAEALEETEPIDAVPLVGTELDAGAQIRGERHLLDLVEIGQAGEEMPKRLRRPDPAERGEGPEHALPVSGRKLKSLPDKRQAE